MQTIIKHILMIRQLIKSYLFLEKNSKKKQLRNYIFDY